MWSVCSGYRFSCSLRHLFCKQVRCVAGRDAALRNARRIERNHLVQLAVAFEFLLILLSRVHQQFKKRLTTPSFLKRDGRIPTYRGRKRDQGIQLSQVPVA